MANVQILRQFDLQALLHRFAKKQNITLFVFLTKLVAISIIILSLLATGAAVVLGILGSRGNTLEVTNRIYALRDVLNKPVALSTPADTSAVIMQRAVFGNLGPSVQPTTATAPPPSPLSLSLIGTFLQGGQEPYAIIEDKKKQTQDVFIGNQSIFNQATLKRIYVDRVEIEREGKIEVLKLDDVPGAGDGGAPGNAAASGDEFVVDEKELDQALENLPLLLTQARAVPYFQAGRAVGLRLFAIKSGSLYERIGLKNGDILKSINGNSLGDLSQALKLFEQLKSERSIAVTLERDKGDREFKYQIR